MSLCKGIGIRRDIGKLLKKGGCLRFRANEGLGFTESEGHFRRKNRRYIRFRLLVV